MSMSKLAGCRRWCSGIGTDARALAEHRGSNGVAVSQRTRPRTASTSPIDGKPFTSYLWQTNQRKPVLYPLIAPDGTTRDPRLSLRHSARRARRPSAPRRPVVQLRQRQQLRLLEQLRRHQAGGPRASTAPSTTTASSPRRAARTPANWSPNRPGSASDDPAGRQQRQPILHADHALRLLEDHRRRQARTRHRHDRHAEGAHTGRLPRRQGRPARHPRGALPRVADGEGRHLPATPTASQRTVQRRDTAGATGVYRTSEGKSATQSGARAASGASSPAPRRTARPKPSPSSTTPAIPAIRPTGTLAATACSPSNPLGAHIFDPKAAPLNFTLDTGKSATFQYRVLVHQRAPYAGRSEPAGRRLRRREIDEVDPPQISSPPQPAPLQRSLRPSAPSRQAQLAVPDQRASRTRSPTTSTTPARSPPTTSACSGSSCAASGSKNIADLNSDEVTRAQAILAKYNLRVTDIASPLFKVDWPGAPLSKFSTQKGAKNDTFAATADFKKQDEVLATCIELAKQFKTDKIRCFDFWRLDDVAPYRAAIDDKLRSRRRDHAETRHRPDPRERA